MKQTGLALKGSDHHHHHHDVAHFSSITITKWTKVRPKSRQKN